MNYTFVPSLKRAALFKIAIALWNQDDIKALRKPLYCFRRIIEPMMEETLREKILKLYIPESMKDEIITFIRNIYEETLKWARYHEKNSPVPLFKEFKFEEINDLRWTPRRTVHLRETAEMFIKDPNLSLADRYKLACMYCLKKDIALLWEELPDDLKREFHNGSKGEEIMQPGFLKFWTCDLMGELEGKMFEINGQMLSPARYAFEYAARDGNPVATAYFFERLTPEEVSESLVKTAGLVAHEHCSDERWFSGHSAKYYAEILCLLLSKMNEEKQLEVFKNHTYQVLRCFLCWPYQSCFLAVAQRMWDFLSEEHFEDVLTIIVQMFVLGVIDGFHDYNYQKLFQEFWQKSPSTHRKSVVEKDTFKILVSQLLNVEDISSVLVLLKDATDQDKDELLLSDEVCYAIFPFVYSEKFGLIKWFICKCASSQSTVKEVKKRFQSYLLISYYETKLVDGKLMRNKFYELLDYLIENYYGKGIGVERTESSPAKRLHER